MGKNDYLPLATDAAGAAATNAAASERRELNWKLKLAIPAVVLFALVSALGTGVFNCGGGKGGMKHGMGMNGTMGMHSGMPMHGMEGNMGTSAVAALRAAACPAQPASRIIGDDWDPASDEEYASRAAERLSASVQIQTVSYDDLPLNGSDARFDPHYKFAEWLEATYPVVYDALSHEAVNVHAHLYTWKGSSEGKEKKPILLMAHEDTVPVNPDTEGQWTFPPWSGEVTRDATPQTPGTWVWGRGASDCKNSLTGILGAVEKLVEEGYTPERDVLIAFGYDEEIGGARGAGKIVDVITERYGADGVAFIIDEGFSGVQDLYGTRVASLGMAEKGSLSVTIKVDTPGGHSSVPPEHTGIGIMSRLVSALEEHPFAPTLEPTSPYLQYLSCLAEHAPEFPRKLAKRVKSPRAWPKLARELASKDRIVNSQLATTTAVDLIHGGVKVNALPEVVEATVNHRISYTSSVNETMAHYPAVLGPVLRKLGLTATFFDEDEGKNTSDRHATFSIVEHRRGLEPAPITPSDSSAFAFIGGAIRAVFGDHTVVTPTGMYANTDTARTWGLTRRIYRFTPADLAETVNQHTVNERISLRAHLATTQFYYRIIRNLEGWEEDAE